MFALLIVGCFLMIVVRFIDGVCCICIVVSFVVALLAGWILIVTFRLIGWLLLDVLCGL